MEDRTKRNSNEIVFAMNVQSCVYLISGGLKEKDLLPVEQYVAMESVEVR